MTATKPVSDPSGEARGAPAPRLDSADLAVWGGFLEVHTRLMRLLDGDLVATHGMALRETHSANVRQLFLTPLDQDQKKAIAAGWQSIRAALDQRAPGAR